MNSQSKCKEEKIIQNLPAPPQFNTCDISPLQTSKLLFQSLCFPFCQIQRIFIQFYWILLYVFSFENCFCFCLDSFYLKRGMNFILKGVDYLPLWDAFQACSQANQCICWNQIFSIKITLCDPTIVVCTYCSSQDYRWYLCTNTAINDRI